MRASSKISVTKDEEKLKKVTCNTKNLTKEVLEEYLANKLRNEQESQLRLLKVDSDIRIMGKTNKGQKRKSGPLNTDKEGEIIAKKKT